MLFRTRTETACHPSTATKKLAVEIRCRTRELCVSGMRAFASKKGTWFARGVFVFGVVSAGGVVRGGGMNTTLRQHTPWDDQIISMDGCSGSWRCLPAWAAPAAREGVLYFGSVRWAAGGPALHSCPGVAACPACPARLPAPGFQGLHFSRPPTSLQLPAPGCEKGPTPTGESTNRRPQRGSHPPARVLVR